MSKNRKTIRLLLTVSVPAEMSAADARREVRTLINDQCNYDADPGDVRARAVKPLTYDNFIGRPKRLVL